MKGVKRPQKAIIKLLKGHPLISGAINEYAKNTMREIRKKFVRNGENAIV